MSDPYLIAHVVRGKPAFDIANRITEGELFDLEGEWWIIPTSGHRAYPYRWWNMDDLCDGSDYDAPTPTSMLDTNPDGWPDHYPAPSAKPRLSLLAKLFPPKPTTPVRRRV